ncbi:sugar ABC transporter substrate-binding protein [Streptomyces sp. AJS327]|uniref:ABC transporter substrate-binding protein n=1 Tax=Streptomyces sp. AJS327 TaxID=2545265 RepID=UPI0015DEBF85|nr:sugar ABC transporter substrate-binding protein [Streptomyces sp. AJS327]MBA0053220.1 sugar ABC transporter substrate-binding protein [Streptomyces sp. AJS327]
MTGPNTLASARTWRLAIPLLTAAALVAGCTQGSATRSRADDGRRIVHYMTFSAAPDHLKDLATLEKSFEADHPDIDVRVQTAPFDQYFTKLQTSVAGGTAPDVFELNQDNFATYADSGALADLDDRVEKDRVARHFTNSSLSAFTYRGTQYGLPSSFSTELLFYNKELFDRAGVAHPTADWTWKDEQRAAEKIRALGGGVFGDFQHASYLEFTKALVQRGGRFLSKDGTKVAFDSPEGVATVKWLTNKVGSTMPTQAQMGGTTDYDTKLFTDGKLGMWHTGSWFFPAVADSGLKDWDVVLEPAATRDRRANSVFQNTLALSSQSRNADAAWRWMHYLTTSDEVAQLRIDTSWELSPATSPTLRRKYEAETPPAGRAAVFDALKDVAPSPQLVNHARISDILTRQLDAVILGSTTPEKALSKAAAEIQPLLDPEAD